jgi:CHAD domain-containing protein
VVTSISSKNQGLNPLVLHDFCEEIVGEMENLSTDSQEMVANASSEGAKENPIEEATNTCMGESNTHDFKVIPYEHVLNLALTLFDHTQSLHGLNENDRRLLEMAVRMQNLPISAGKKKAYQAMLEAVQFHFSALYGGLAAEQEVSIEQQRVLAATIGFIRGKLNRGEVSHLELSPIQQHQVLTMAALIRIAIGLDQSRSGETTIQKIEEAQDGWWIVVEGPQAVNDAHSAQRSARLWEKIGYPEIQVLETQEAAIQLQPFPEPMEQIGVLPTDTFAEAGRKVMRYHFAQMLRHEEGTRLGEDIEVLHDMRVATRRLRAAFEVFGKAFEPGVLKPYLTGLRATGRALGNVRDLDVFMEKARHYLQTLPEEEQGSLDPLISAWQERRENARSQMLEHLDSREYAAFKRKYNVFLNTPGAGARKFSDDRPSPHLVNELAPLLVYTGLASVRAFDSFLIDASIELLHALRIEFKKLRYTVEYFKEVLGKKAELVIEDLKLIQDHLGDLNDAQVATQLLREFIDSWESHQTTLSIGERQNLEGVVNYLAARHAERHHLMVTFRQTWKSNFANRRFRRNLAQAVSVL